MLRATEDPVADLQRDPAVNIGYADPGSDSYVSVSGKATVVEDAARKKRLWSKFAEAWFPGGPEDPNLALIRVQIEEAEYWNVKESKVTQLFKMARASLTKEPPGDMGEHAKDRLLGGPRGCSHAARRGRSRAGSLGKCRAARRAGSPRTARRAGSTRPDDCRIIPRRLESGPPAAGFPWDPEDQRLHIAAVAHRPLRLEHGRLDDLVPGRLRADRIRHRRIAGEQVGLAAAAAQVLFPLVAAAGTAPSSSRCRESG